MFQRTVTINGLSKSASMTGWRFGYLATPKVELIKAMNKLQSQSTSNISSITQAGAIAGLNGSVDKTVQEMRKVFEQRRDEAYEIVNNIDGLSVVKPDGAFYLFINIKDVSSDSMEFSKELLAKEGVAVVPGIAFGAEGYIRLSFATDIDTIREGLKRLDRFVKNLKK